MHLLLKFTVSTKEWYLNLDVTQKEAICISVYGKSFGGITFGVLQWTLYSMLYHYGVKEVFVKGMTKTFVQETTLQANQIRQKK